MMKPEFIPDYSEISKMYFPDGEVINDLAIARRIDGDRLKQSLEYNGRQNLVRMPQFDSDEIVIKSTVPRNVQSPVEVKQYLDSVRRIGEDEHQRELDRKLNDSLRKYLE